MIYRFEQFELDLMTLELRASREPISLEPQVFALLALLVENHDRLVSKDEIIEKVWDGRVVSEAAVASRVKSARQALGDDGVAQRFIKTVHRRGFRFVARVAADRGPVASSSGACDFSRQDTGSLFRQLDQLSRPSIAVLPFRVIGDPGPYEALGSALPDELITELCRLRWLFVTARGSSFRVPMENVVFSEVGRLLNVRYCLSGTVEISDRGLIITVDLVDTHDEGIVWADRLAGRLDDVHALRQEIKARVLTALDIRIPMHEASAARLAAPDDLDAWSAYHLGLQHIYRFNRTDNATAAHLFERAICLEPCFARAHAGLSFVHFQTAFMHYTDDVAGEVLAARRSAERGLEFDALDPFVNFTMGRSYWLEGDLDSSMSWLERATSISPNYAQGVYARAWTEILAGCASEGKKHVDLAMRLSPIDPLYYAMMATRAFAYMLEGDYGQAADWAERAARSPGAHVLIAMIAAAGQLLKGDAARAGRWAANVRERNATLRREDFLRAFPMKSEAMRSRLLDALRQLGF